MVGYRYTEIRPIRGSTEEWQLNDIILEENEIGVELVSDNIKRIKLGDGIHKWSELPYAINFQELLDIIENVKDYRDLIFQNTEIIETNKIESLNYKNEVQGVQDELIELKNEIIDIQNDFLPTLDEYGLAFDYTITDPIKGNIWFRKEELGNMASILFTATVGDNTLHLRTQTAGFDCIIYWGDGTSTVCPIDGGNVIHTYAEAGDKVISINGNSFAGFYVNNQIGKEKYKTLFNLGKWTTDTFTSLEGAFFGCNNLTKIKKSALWNIPNLLNINNAFIGTGLESIPLDIFRYNTKITEAKQTFGWNDYLKTIPIDIFRYNTKITDFTNVFNSCYLLETIPSELFKYNTEAFVFEGVFGNCTKLQIRDDIFGYDYTTRFLDEFGDARWVSFNSIFSRDLFFGVQGTLPSLWLFDIGTGSNILHAFDGAGNNENSLTNYHDIPASWLSIPASILYSATVGDNILHLTSQTAGFDCTIDWGDSSTTVCPVDGGNVIHTYATAGDYTITISGNSFAGFCVNGQTDKEKYKTLFSMGKWKVDTMITAASAFSGCGNLTTITYNSFRYVNKITTMYAAFKDCGINSIPVNLFKYLTEVTSFTATFYNCFNLEVVPEDIFRYNLKVLSFKQIFITCDILENLPANLFKYNTLCTDFSYAFRYSGYVICRHDLFGTDYQNRFNGKTVNFTDFFYNAFHYSSQGTAPELWNFIGLTATKSGSFGGAGNSDISLTNYHDIPASWLPIPASILYSATVGDNILHLKVQNNGFDCTIDWGDSSTTVAPVDGGNVIHTYATAGDYTITISGNSFAGFKVNYATERTKYKTLFSMGKWVNDTCLNIDYAFYGCKFTSISKYALDYIKNITSSIGAFRSCDLLETLPENLFKYNLSITDYSGLFRFANKLILRNDIFGTDNTIFKNKTMNFETAFARDTYTASSIGIAPDIWNWEMNSDSNKKECFYGLGMNSISHISNYENILFDWKCVWLKNHSAVKGDGITDDTAAIQNFMNLYKNIYFEDYTFLIDGLVSLILKNNQNIKLSSNAIIQAIPNSSENYSILKIDGVSNVTIKGGNLIGDRLTHTGTTGEWGHGINIINGSNNILIDGIKITNCWGDGIYLGGSSLVNNIQINNVLCDNNRRQGMSITNATNVNSYNSVFSNTNGTSPQSGVDIEPNVGQKAEDITFTNCQFIENHGCGLQLYGENGTVQRITTNNCIINNNITMGIYIWTSSNSIFNSTTIENNYYGVNIVKDSNNITFNDSVFNLSRRHGTAIISDGQITGIENITFNNVTFSNNSTEGPNYYDGIRIDRFDTTGYIRNIDFNNCDFLDNQTVHSQRYGITVGLTSGEISNITVDSQCEFSGNIIDNYLAPDGVLIRD